MKKIFPSSIHLILTLLILANCLSAAHFTEFVEDPSDPIYNPYVSTAPSGEDYFPFVIFNSDQFNGDGDAFYYKMWHQGPDGIALSYSNDGISWTLKGETTLQPGYHPCVVYDPNNFGGGLYSYKIWYWNGFASQTPNAILFAQSTDGFNWTPPIPCQQDLLFPIVFGNSGPFYHLYGPGFVIYNPVATSTPGQPLTFPYVLYYDSSSEDDSPGMVTESIALAYSNDGITWTRYGDTWVIQLSGDAAEWDANYAFRPSIVSDNGIFHMFYSGSNSHIGNPPVIPYAHGIGHASSADGVNWTLDQGNPIFYYADGVAWRDTRTYTPFVLFGTFCDPTCSPCTFKMWFGGGTGPTTGEEEGIGYATLPCPPMPPPRDLTGRQGKDKFLTQTDIYNHLQWLPSVDVGTTEYRIYRNGQLIGVVPASSPLEFNDHNIKKNAINTYGVTAFEPISSESDPITITIP